MAKEEFHDLLIKLHSELEQTGDVGKEDQELLEHLMADISGILVKDDEVDESSSQLFMERLEQAINQFEISHPTLTWSMGKVLDLLNSSGI